MYPEWAAVTAAGDTFPCSVTQDNYGAYIGWLTGWPNEWCRVVTGYSLSSIPAAATVENAKLSCSYPSEYGSPFVDFGNIQADHIRYDNSNLAEGFSITRTTALGNILSSSVNSATLDVTAVLNLDRNAGRSALQFRFKFAKEPADPGANPKFGRFYFNGTGACKPLDVTYLAP